MFDVQLNISRPTKKGKQSKMRRNNKNNQKWLKDVWKDTKVVIKDTVLDSFSAS